MAEKKGISLNQVPGLPGEVIERLAAYWITTVEELVGAAVREGGLAGLSSVTGLSEGEVTALVERAQAVLPPGVTFAPGEVRRHGLGAIDDPEEGGEGEAPSSFAPLPDSADLHLRFGPVRNQGDRGTCVAHACVAVREYLTGSGSPSANLSEQFLYWDCKRVDLLPLPGTFVRVGMNRLLNDGVPPEMVWPYNPAQIPGNEGQDPPPANAMAQARPYRVDAYQKLNATDVHGLRAALAAGTPVAFAMPVYTSWFAEPTYSSGDVRLPLPGEKKEGGHAMCLVGYQVDPAVPGGGYFKIRNSWGTVWGCNNVVAPGYGRIPFAYFEQYCTAAYTASVKPVSWWQAFVTWLRRLLKFGYAK